MINIDQYQTLLNLSGYMTALGLVGVAIAFIGILLVMASESLWPIIGSAIGLVLFGVAGFTYADARTQMEEILKAEGYYEVSIDGHTFEGVRGEDGSDVLCIINETSGKIDCVER